MKIPILRYKNYQWFNYENPGDEEIEYLKKKFPFHPLNLEDYQTKTQSPKFDLYRHYVLFVFDFPYFSPGGERIFTSEVAVCCDRLSKAPAQPTQYKISISELV